MIRKPYFKGPNNKGFTLVEILVAMAVLAIVTIPLLSYFSDASKLNALSSKRHKANLMAQKYMEDIKNKELKEIVKEYRAYPGLSGQYLDSGYSDGNKIAFTSPFAFTANPPEQPYYFQILNADYGGEKYDVRIKISEGIYASPSGVAEFNSFLDFNVNDVEGNKNAVISEGLTDSMSASLTLYNLYLEHGYTDTSGFMFNSIQNSLKRVIKLGINQGTDGKIKVTCSFVYSCPSVPLIAGEVREMQKFEKTFNNLDAVYIFYRPLYTSSQQEEIQVTSNIPGAEKLSSLFDIYILGKDAETLLGSYSGYKLYETSSVLTLMQDGEGNFSGANSSLKNNVPVKGGGFEVPPVESTYRNPKATLYNKMTVRDPRMYEIEVSVYQAGHAGESDKLIFTLNSAEDD